jgi:hypothetical protein
MTDKQNGSSYLCEVTNIGTAVNDFNAAWPFFTIGLDSVTLGSRGWLGNLADLWYAPTGVNSADTFPTIATPPVGQFVKLGRFIHTWTSDATVPLLV